MQIVEASSLADVCFAVCTALDRAGILAVLTGGSAATYYAPHAYQSKDADFVIKMSREGSRGADVLRSLGYRQIGGTYIHGDNRYTVDFPPGPLAVGQELISTHETLRRAEQILHILSRTDCVRDRLAAFYFFADRSALSAAISVAMSG